MPRAHGSITLQAIVLCLAPLFLGTVKDVPEAPDWSPPGQPGHISKRKTTAECGALRRRYGP